MRDNGDEDSVVDLTEWVPLVSYIRGELRLGASVDIQLRLVGTPAVAHNQSSLAGIHRMLDRKAASLQEPIVLEAHRRVLPGEGAAGATHTGVAAPELRPNFDLRPLSQQELAALLRPLCYPADYTEEGEWTVACGELMMQSPSLLLGFDELRAEGFARAIGDGRFLLNPLRIACPACTKVLWLAGANNVGNLESHLRTCKATGAAAIRHRLEAWRNIERSRGERFERALALGK